MNRSGLRCGLSLLNNRNTKHIPNQTFDSAFRIAKSLLKVNKSTISFTAFLYISTQFTFFNMIIDTGVTIDGTIEKNVMLRYLSEQNVKNRISINAMRNV